LRDELSREWGALGQRFTFMTGGGLPRELVDRIRASACPILDKPIEPDELLAHLAKRIAELGTAG
jgi:hypothetical protein